MTTLAFLQNLGALEIGIICIVALLLFGDRLPTVARSIGKTMTEFKRGIQDATDEVKHQVDVAAEEAEKAVKDDPKTKKK